MGDYYEQTIPHPIDAERVMLFTLCSSKKKNWYCRILKREGDGYFQKSLRTTNKDLAMEKARKLYLAMWSVEEKGLEYTDARFSPCFREFLFYSGMNPDRHTRAKSIFGRYMGEFFGETPVRQIDNKMWQDYLRFRTTYWTNAERGGVELPDHYRRVPAESTLRSERQILKQFLYWCAENGIIEHVPRLTWKYAGVRGVKFNTERRRCKALTESMEMKIERKLRSYCVSQNTKDKERQANRRFGRARLYYFIYICRHTLIRPSKEALSLRWEDVTFQDSRKEPGLRLATINVRDSKTGIPRVAVMPYGQVELLTKWRGVSREFGMGEPGDYVFPKWDHTTHDGKTQVEAHILGRLLRRKLLEWGLHRTEAGKVITLYSIARHTGITRRIEVSGWNVGQVATAAGTSIKQISDFYYESFVRADPDKWAKTFRGEVRIEDAKAERIRDAVEAFESAPVVDEG